MKLSTLPASLACAALLCALPLCVHTALAQPDVAPQLVNGLPFPLVAPEAAQKAALPTPLVFHFQDVTLRAALDELQKQSGVPLDNLNNALAETLDKTLTLDLETLSFNEAFREITDEAGVKASLQRWNYDQPWRVDFNQTDYSANAQQSAQGLFSARLTGVTDVLSKSVDLNNAKTPARSQEHFLNASLALLPDVRLPIIGSSRSRVTRAEDEAGHSLIAPPDPNDGDNSAWSFYNNNWQRSRANLRLKAPAEGARALAHLDGVMIYALVTKAEKWEVPDLLAQPTWTRHFESGEATFDVTITPTLKENKLTLKVEVASNQTVDYERVSHPLLAYGPILEALKIEDANGIEFHNNGSSSSSDNDNAKLTVTANYYPRDTNGNADENGAAPALPLKMTFNAPVGVVQTEVPFSFENVPLP